MRYPIHFTDKPKVGAYLTTAQDTTALCGKHITAYQLETGEVKRTWGNPFTAYVTCPKCLAKIAKMKENQNNIVIQGSKSFSEKLQILKNRRMLIMSQSMRDALEKEIAKLEAEIK